MSASSRPSILFVLTQPYASTISNEEIVQAIPLHLKSVHYEVIPVDINSGDLAKLGEVDFIDLRNRQAQFVKERVKPRFLSEPNRHVLYVGKAPIPLAVHLGCEIESFEKTDAAFQVHRSNEWYYEPREESATSVEIFEPSGSSLASGDVTIKIETSYHISDGDVLTTIPKPLACYALRTNKIDPDCMDGRLAKEVVRSLLNVLSNIHKNFPNRNGIHLFMSIPMGLAFEIGAALNPTIHHPIFTYQYFRGQDPPYRKAIAIGEEGATVASLNLDDREDLKQTTDVWKQELAALQKLATNLAGAATKQPDQIWIDRLFPGHDFNRRLDSNFRMQTSIADSTVGDFSIADTFDESGIEFFLEPKNKRWIIGEFLGHQFWLASGRDKSKLSSLVRLFLLHEAVHSERQTLHTENSDNIGRFSRVLEEIDYQADVWAICHELYYALKIQRVSASPRVLALDLIETIVNTFMAFDKASGFREGYQVRRLNRYLLWLWQYILLTESRIEITVEQVVEIILNKPVIDIAGPQIVCRNERIFLTLAAGKLINPEIAVYYAGIFSRHEGSSAIKIFEGLQEFKIEKMITGLREVYHRVKK